MTNYREILRQQSLGMLKKDIAASCGCSRNTVARALAKAAEQGLGWEGAKGLSNEELAGKLFPKEEAAARYKMPDWAAVHREMGKSGVTLSLLLAEYREQCRDSGELPYKKSQFNKYYAEYVRKTKATMRIARKPGEIMEVDWAGQTAFLKDSVTGKGIKAYVFVATLPYSGYSYVEAFLSMKEEDWINGHVNAYAYFGGVTRILVPDNLKTGVTKHTRTETVINKTYQELAEHYGTAVIPARVRSPKDKATVEGTVGVISTWIIAALRDGQFFSLRELNQAVRGKLREFNGKPFQKKDGSRASVFEEERRYLLPLPEHAFEPAVWKIATVQFNYHVSVEGQNYSVPYEYIRQKVNVRLTRGTVEVFYGDNRIASHQRLYGRSGQYATVEAHMPREHREYLEWNGERFLLWADKIGGNTRALVKLFLTRNKVEQQGYKSCIALLKLAGSYSPAALERACQKALSLTERPGFKAVQSILKLGAASAPARENASPEGFTRGQDYYRREEEQ